MQQVNMTIHGVTGISVANPHSLIFGGAAAVLRVDTKDGPVEIDIFAESLEAVTALAVEESEVAA